MKVIITGATGYVGEGVLLALLDDERIEKVLSVGRRPCGHSHERETQAMGFRHAFGWRPMFMKPYPGQKNKQLVAQKTVAFFHPLNHLMRVSCTMREMVDAMYNVVVNGYHRNNIESWDIIRCAHKKE